MKLYQILSESKYKDEELIFFEQYSKNHAASPDDEGDSDSTKIEPKEPEKKVEPKKIEPEKKLDKDEKKDADGVKFKGKHGVTSSEKIQKPSVYQDIMNYGAYMGEGLYSISDYEYSHNLSTTEADIKNINKGRLDDNSVFFNNLLYTTINKLKLTVKNSHDIERFLNINPEHFWKGGAIHCIIYDSFNDNIMFYYADPSVDRYAHLISKDFDKASFVKRQEKIVDKDLTENQIELIQNSIKLGDQYIDHFKSNPKSNSTNLLRYRLLYSLGITMTYLPPAETYKQL